MKPPHDGDVYTIDFALRVAAPKSNNANKQGMSRYLFFVTSVLGTVTGMPPRYKLQVTRYFYQFGTRYSVPLLVTFDY